MKQTKVFSLIIVLFLFIAISCREANFTQPNSLEKIEYALHHPEDNTILVAAHRASHSKYPENSLEAIRHTIEIGADIIEIDVRHTIDGHLILMHDGTVDRTTNGKGDVKSITFTKIRSLRLDGSDKNHVYQIPTFTEAMQEAKGKILVDIDIKSAAVSKLVNIIHKLDMGNQVIFFDSDFAVLDSVKMLDSTLMVMPRAHSADKLKWMIERYTPPIIHIDPGFFTPEVVQTIKDGHSRIWINALGKPDILALLGFGGWSYTSLMNGGANVIQTDRPAAMLKFLVKKEKHW